MRIISIFLIASFGLALKADFCPLHTRAVDAAYDLDLESYMELRPKQKMEYAHAIAEALHNGKITRENIIERANQQLCYDVARAYYLMYEQIVDLKTDNIAFPIRTLIQHNRLQRIVTEHGELDLSYLHIADTDGIEDIPDIHKVRSINLSHNEISLIGPNKFKGLGSLKHLDLSFNNISIIRPSTFRHLPNLETLSLSHNFIVDLNRDGFLGLPALTELYLAYNKIKWIGMEAFEGLNHLKNLDLSNNQLRIFVPGVLKPLRHVKSLNLSHNNFNMIHGQVLYPLRHLEHLDLSNNRLTRITGETLYGLKKLHTLNLRNNQITVLDINKPNTLPNLNTIILGNNPIKNQRVAALQKQLNGPSRTVKILAANPAPSPKDTTPATLKEPHQRLDHTAPKPLRIDPEQRTAA
jgi:Leucine-rich repeat (LRR) protein